MHSSLCIGHVPLREPSARPGDADYARRSEIEARVYLRMLKRLFPVPEGLLARLTVQSCRDDDGYEHREVVVRYDGQCPVACKYAFSVQAGKPARWDTTAVGELSWLTQQAVFHALVRQGLLSNDAVPARFRGVLPPEDIAHDCAASAKPSAQVA